MAQAQPDVGTLLRHWRRQRRLSQLELANRAKVSTRHVSYIENGRARPTAVMIDRLAQELEVPLRERNSLLLAGGFAPKYGPRALDDETLAPVLDGLRHLLDGLLPSPALLLDDHWNILDANASAHRVMASCANWLLEPPVNAVLLSLHPQGLGTRIRNLDALGGSIWHRVRSRAEATQDPALWRLLAQVELHIAPPTTAPVSTEPVLSLELETPEGVMRFFTIAAQLETATDATLAELHVEAFIPGGSAEPGVVGDTVVNPKQLTEEKTQQNRGRWCAICLRHQSQSWAES